MDISLASYYPNLCNTSKVRILDADAVHATRNYRAANYETRPPHDWSCLPRIHRQHTLDGSSCSQSHWWNSKWLRSNHRDAARSSHCNHLPRKSPRMAITPLAECLGSRSIASPFPYVSAWHWRRNSHLRRVHWRQNHGEPISARISIPCLLESNRRCSLHWFGGDHGTGGNRFGYTTNWGSCYGQAWYSQYQGLCTLWQVGC